MNCLRLASTPRDAGGIGARQAGGIFVFGCARSGTTLLLNLFRCCADTVVLDREHKIGIFEMSDPHDGQHVVVKRTPRCAQTLVEDLKRFPRLWLVDIYRDPRDVVTSVHEGIPGFYTDFARWRRDVSAAREAAEVHERTIHVRFEDLLKTPDETQAAIVGALGLRSETPFSRAHELFDYAALSTRSIAALGGIRPMDLTRIGRWREHGVRVLAQVDEHPDLVGALVKHGYEESDAWLNDLRAVDHRRGNSQSECDGSQR